MQLAAVSVDQCDIPAPEPLWKWEHMACLADGHYTYWIADKQIDTIRKILVSTAHLLEKTQWFVSEDWSQMIRRFYPG